MKAGCGWLPQSWLFEDGVRRSLRGLAAENVELDGYGDPRGHLPLREWIRDALAEQEVSLQPDQVLLTHGSSHALDLAIRRLVRAGDAVLVDDPGYSNLLFALRVAGARLIPVPRTPQGYDLAALEEAIVTHHPRVFFTQPRLQSPTASTATLAQLHRVLQLADKHGLTVVENDLYVDLDPDPRPSLASLDQLARVLYVGSYSKTISPNLRVGYIAAHPALIDDLAQLKMISGLTSSAFSERLILGALTRRPLAQAPEEPARAPGRGARGLRPASGGARLRAVPRAQGGHVPVGAPSAPARPGGAVQPRGAARHHAGARQPVQRHAAADRLDAVQRGVRRRSAPGGVPRGGTGGDLTPLAPRPTNKRVDPARSRRSSRPHVPASGRIPRTPH